MTCAKVLSESSTFSLGIEIICCYDLSLNPRAALSISIMRFPSLKLSPFLLTPLLISERVKWFSGERRRFWAMERCTRFSQISIMKISYFFKSTYWRPLIALNVINHLKGCCDAPNVLAFIYYLEENLCYLGKRKVFTSILSI